MGRGLGNSEQNLGMIINKKDKYLIELVGKDNKNNTVVKYGYRTYEGIDENQISEMTDYAIERTKLENIHGDVTLTKINVFSLESKLIEEIKIGQE